MMSDDYSRPTKRASLHNTSTEDASEEPQRKRRRRVISCQSCQKSKTRCELSPGVQSCRRCQNLRLTCSLRENNFLPEPTTVDKHSRTLEQRLHSQEQRISELLDLVKDLRKGVAQPQPIADTSNSSRAKKFDYRLSTEPRDAEEVSDIATLTSHSSPVVVLREIGQRFTGSHRQALDNASLDLVSNGIVDRKYEGDMISQFFSTLSHSRLLYDRQDLSTRRDVSSSRFLRAVCFLRGMACHGEMRDTPLHREVHSRVRTAMGSALLWSPLTLEQTYGILLMTDGMVEPATEKNESPYIDSWLLTGFCAQQAMLAIQFSRIVSNISQDDTTPEDHRAIRLWSIICLQHLHWATATGKPSVIDDMYLNQCNNLISFYDASLQDTMLVAEIQLYSVLIQALGRCSSSSSAAETEQFASWKKKWSHLLSMPTASNLKLGYFSACLTLVTRQLEAVGEDLYSRTFLGDSILGDAHPGSNQSNGAVDETADLKRDLRKSCSELAENILRLFLELRPVSRRSLTTDIHLCVAYCVLIIAHYDESQSGLSDEDCLDLVLRIDDYYSKIREFSRVTKFPKIAQRRLQSRMKRASSNHEDVSYQASLSLDPAMAPMQEQPGIGGQPATDFPTSPGDIISPFEIPSMQDFFGGAFLDFLQPSLEEQF